MKGIFILVVLTALANANANDLCTQLVGSFTCERVVTDLALDNVSKRVEHINLSIQDGKVFQMNTSLGYNFDYCIGFENVDGYMITDEKADCGKNEIDISLKIVRPITREATSSWKGKIVKTALGFNSVENKLIRGGEITRVCIKD